jgi:hypothetical protein
MMTPPIRRSWLFSRAAGRLYFVSAILGLALLISFIAIAFTQALVGPLQETTAIHAALLLLLFPGACGISVLGGDVAVSSQLRKRDILRSRLRTSLPAARPHRDSDLSLRTLSALAAHVAVGCGGKRIRISQTSSIINSFDSPSSPPRRWVTHSPHAKPQP